MTRKFEDSKAPWAPIIPVGWKAIRNKFLLIGSYSGGTPAATNPRFYNDEGIPFISIADMSNVDYVEKTEKHVTEAGMTDKNLQIVPRGSVIYSMYATVGHVAETKIDATISQAMIALYLSEKYDKAYYKYSLRAIRDYIFGSAEGTTQMNLNAQKVYEMFLLQPPIPEQQSIVSYLDKKCAAIDEAIARHKQIIEKLEEYRSIQISSMATKGINPDSPLRVSGTDWYGKIPKNWEIKRFKYVAEVKSNLVDPRPYMALNQIGPDLIEKNSGRLVGSRTVEEAGIISGNHLFHAGQILYSKVRPALNKVVIAPFDGLCSADMYPIETSMDAEYLKYLMLSKPFAEQVRIIAMIRVKMPKINQDELGDVLCVVPPMDQQKEIASSITEMCNQIEAVISRHNEIIEKLEEYRKSIIYNAVTGKIDCREVV